MMSKQTHYIFLFFFWAALSACGGGSSGSNTNILGSEQSREGALVGNWNYSIGDDEWYLVFRQDNEDPSSYVVVSYDYAGDAFDNFANCYWIDFFEFRSIGNNQYEVFFSGVDTEQTVTFRREGNNLIETFEGEELIIPPSTIPESSYIPDCDSSVNNSILAP